MTGFAIFAVAGAALVAIGLHGALVRPHLLRKIMAMNVLGGGVFLFFIALSTRAPDGAVDPVPQALVLTGIVVAVSVSAFGVALARRIHRRTGRTELTERDIE